MSQPTDRLFEDVRSACKIAKDLRNLIAELEPAQRPRIQIHMTFSKEKQQLALDGATIDFK